MTKKILIIGAGIAGLSAGIHACLSGYSPVIYEKNHEPGGLCSARQVGSYTFEGSMDRLKGTGPGSQFNDLWAEICPIEEMKIINHEKLFTIDGEEAGTLHFYSDMDRLEAHLTEKFPQSSPEIKEICSAAKKMSRHVIPLDKVGKPMRIGDVFSVMFKMLPIFNILGRYSRISVEEYLERVKDPFLKEAFSLIMPGGYGMINLLSMLAGAHALDAGYPEGGAPAFSRLLEERFIELGGKVHYNSAVKEVLVEEDFAVGLVLSDGLEVRGDYVISAADLHHTVYRLLKGRYNSVLIKDSFKVLSTYTQVSLFFGVDKELLLQDHKLMLKLESPINLGGITNRYLELTNYSFDPTLAPPGKTVVRTRLNTDYSYWQSVAKDERLYEERKKRLTEQVWPVISKRLSLSTEDIEASAVVTPYSYRRDTNTYKGAFMSWIVPPEAGRFKISFKLPGLSDFYQIGQWISPPAGLDGAMLSGRQVMQLICASEKRAFWSPDH